MSKKIDGAKIAEKIKDQVAKEIFELKGARPNLAIVLIGDRPDSELYVSLKEKEAKKVGIDTHLYKCDDDTSEQNVLELVEHLNNDELIDGILVQLPLPENLDTDKIINTINPEKDVDGFHPKNKILTSPVHETVLEMLSSINCKLNDKNVVILSNSDVFSSPLVETLNKEGAKTTSTRANDSQLKQITSEADILITAVGKPHLIKKDMVKEDAVVIDIGITKKDSMVFGDVDYDDVFKKVAYITPVPGGVGPMTIAILFRNTLELFKRNQK